MARSPNSSQQTLTVLGAFIARPVQWRHGYDLAGETGLKSGTLYPLLMRLADQGLLESRWEMDEGSRPRHVYRLTREGATFAREQIRTRAPALVGKLHKGRA
jgi:PadR family transcriptional regulator, regulatory protein PadR